MERGGRGGGRGRGRGRGKAKAAARSSNVTGRVKEEAKRKAGDDSADKKKQKVSAEISGQLTFDESGRVIADIPPPKKFPAATSCTLLHAFLQSVEYGAQSTRTNQTMQSEKPRRLLDHMKVKAVETWPERDELIKSIWKVPRSASNNNELQQIRKFFNSVMDAMEKDLDAAEECVGIDKNAMEDETSASKGKKLLKDIDRSMRDGAAPPPFWIAADPDNHLYTDSEEEADGRNQRYPPALQTLRKLRRRLIRDEQRNLLMGRSLALVKEGATSESIAGDNRESMESRLHTEKIRARNDERARLRDWMKASLYAQRQLSWAPNNDLYKFLAPIDETMKPKSTSIVALFRTELARLFPSRLMSAELARFALDGQLKALPSPYKCILDDSLCLTDKELGSWSLKESYKITEESCRFYFGNLLQMLGRPMGRSYSHLMFHQDFKFWLLSLAEKGLQPLQTINRIRPPSRQLRALIARRLGKTSGNREVDETLINAIGNITSAGAVGQTHTQAAAAIEYEDSEASRSEDEQYVAETSALKAIATKPEQTDFSMSGYGAENVLLRIGGGFGHLRNRFDVNRHRRMGLELLKNDKVDPVPLDFESSEEEDRIYIDLQNAYRQHYRKNRREQVKVVPPEQYSEWPYRPTDRLRERLEKEEAEANKKVKAKKSKKRKSGEEAAAAFDRSVAIEAEIGMKEETWRAFNFKSRVRHVESRMDLGKNQKRPIGFLARGLTPHGRELQLLGVDEGEVQRRFGLTKLFQKSMPGLSERITHRRHFAAIINEATNTIRLVDAAPCRLILSTTAEEQHRDLMWRFYWHEARSAVHEQHVLKKSLRYRNMYDNNSIVWKDDLDRYQKLREKLNETQAQREIRYMKLRPGTYSAKKELEELGVVNFDYEYAEAPKYDVDAVTESDISEVEYQTLQTVKKLDSQATVGSTCASETEESPNKQDPIPIKMQIFHTDSDQVPLDHVRITMDELKGQARRAKLNAEELEVYSNAKKIRRHLRVAWNGSEFAMRRKIAARHRSLLPTIYYHHSRKYRLHYHRIRAEMAERILYETAWQASAVKRARANPQNESQAQDEDDDD